jgi:4-diphosphocytidyl-2-C-methyl-D-erythritol kinase
MMNKLKTYSKINLGLYITGKRQDAYHNLHSIFIEIDLFDNINYKFLKNTNIVFKTNHKKLEQEKSNTVIKVVNDLNKIKPFGIELFLEKNIPDQAGLGAGSANAAYLLLELEKSLNMNLNYNQLLKIGEKIGADVPFFLAGGIAEVMGIGQTVRPLSINFPYYIIILKQKNLSFSTKDVFSELNVDHNKNDKNKYITKFIEEPTKENIMFLENELEHPAKKISKQIDYMKNILIENGAFYASMTGSGSAVYGLFDNEIKINLNNQDIDIFYTKAKNGNHQN